MTKLNIQYRDPNQLSVHPAIKHIPTLGEEELKPILAGMKYAGEAMQPILVDEEGRILSDTGRTAWLCAKARQLKEVPVCICAAADVHLIVIRDLAHDHRHLSKSAIAYLAVPHLQPALDAARLKRLENLRKGQEIPETALSADSGAITMVELAEELGIGCRMLEMAISVRKEFESKNTYTFCPEGGPQDGAELQMTLRAYFEPRLLKSFIGSEQEHNRPVGLGGILRGIETVRSDKAQYSCKNTNQLELFVGTFGRKAIRQFKSWNAMTAEMKSKARAEIEEEAEAMKPEDCVAAAAALKDIAKIYSDAAKAKA